MRCQAKSKERVQQHGEVFTNGREVKAMLDMVKQQSQSITTTFLEPAYGGGNFLVEILRRKRNPYEASWDFKRNPLV